MTQTIQIQLKSQIVDGEFYSITHNGGKNGYIFDNIDGKYKYSEIKELLIKQIPNNSQLEIYLYNDLNDEELYSLLPFPFDTISFVKVDNSLYFVFSSYVDGNYDENWHKKFTWTYEAFFTMLEQQINQEDIHFGNYIDSYYIDYYVKFVDNQSHDIHTGLIKAASTLKELIQQTIQGLQGLQLFIDAMRFWRMNSNNPNENEWHHFFIENNWVLSQCFSIPAILFQNKAYVGGKDISYKNGGVLDILYKSKMLENLALIEIKTPLTPLIGKEYRDNVFSISIELSGAINQLLHYKDNFLKEYYSIKGKSSESFQLYNPKCILLIGNTEQLNDRQKRSFELFRTELRSIEIITYDEIFEKIGLLRELVSL
ncbi:Shedu immune nuclease family protein [Brevibacillus parabrevis]|uniref:Shedu immune nuclease family protein n=1 Tax=Brevibacillus parabrevis TaxID=54914 RepID=UPI002E24EA03|nr:DUF4263 domain-containing protein [Brevibacillus parabrevis]